MNTGSNFLEAAEKVSIFNITIPYMYKGDFNNTIYSIDD